MRTKMNPSTTIATAALIATLGFLTGACSAGDDSDAEPSPSEKCEHMIATTCSRKVDCAIEEGRIEAVDSSAYNDACVASIREVVPCAEVVGVKSGYPTCIRDLETMPCDTTGLPESCKSVLLK